MSSLTRQPLWRRLYGKAFRRFYGHGPFVARCVTVVIDGIRYRLDLGQLIDNMIYFDGCYEADVSSWLGHHLKPGMTVLDVGANIGCHTLSMARMVGESGKVIAFEPMTWARRKLLRNVSLNDLDNIVVESLGLSDEEEKFPIRFRSNWPLDGRHQPEANLEEDICFVTLDRYAERNQLSIDVIKIDVDGYECRVLRGAPGQLRDCRPLIVMEVERGTNAVEVASLLGEAGYHAHCLESGKRLADLPRAICALPSRYASMNVAFLPGRRHRADTVIAGRPP